MYLGLSSILVIQSRYENISQESSFSKNNLLEPSLDHKEGDLFVGTSSLCNAKCMNFPATYAA